MGAGWLAAKRYWTQPALDGSDAEVVKLLSEGLGRPKIAKQLSITEGTVDSRIAKLLAKLGVLREVEA